MKNKLILFDWGNIVESHLKGYTCYDAFNDIFYKCGYRGDKEIFGSLGKYNICCIKSIKEFEKVYDEIAKDFNFNKSYNEFIDIYNKVFDKVDYFKDVAYYEVSLKSRCSIGILSDLTVFDKDRLDKQVGLDNYDYVFLSFELGLRKPNIELFKKIQNELPFEPNNILFIDDRKCNVDAAKEIGWNTLQATGLELDKIKDKCEEFLNN